jgi:hypothetical protein
MLIDVHVADANGGNVANATVSISITGPVSGQGSATTGSGGTATFRMTHAPSGSYTTSITGVTGSNMTWDTSHGYTSTNTYVACYPTGSTC